jgi:dTDP-4-amino-4,6-dideoxygalactose transaminase
MVTTSDEELARKVRMLRDHGSETRYYHEELGWNARLDELQAAALRVKLPHLDGWNEKRRGNADLYNQLLASANVVTPYVASDHQHIYHLYVIRTTQRDVLRSFLNDQGIGTGIHYPVPIHMQNAFKFLDYNPGDLPVTETITGEILTLPMYAELTADQVETVGNAILDFEKTILPAMRY